MCLTHEQLYFRSCPRGHLARTFESYEVILQSTTGCVYSCVCNFLPLIGVIFSIQMEVIAGIVYDNSILEVDSNSNIDVETEPSCTIQVGVPYNMFLT